MRESESWQSYLQHHKKEKQTLPVLPHIKLCPIISLDTVIDLSEGQPSISPEVHVRDLLGLLHIQINRRGPFLGFCSIALSRKKLAHDIHYTAFKKKVLRDVSCSYHGALVEGLLSLLTICCEMFCGTQRKTSMGLLLSIPLWGCPIHTVFGVRRFIIQYMDWLITWV
jgi:hypothetical protein